jgi:predicted lipoprotein with Yx(FWY)xxD motif
MRVHHRFVLPALLTVAVAGAATVSLAQAAMGHGPRSTGKTVDAHAMLMLRSSKYGKAIFDANENVLYVFAADRGSTSHCYGSCAAAWPPMLTKGAPVAGPGLNANLLGTTKRSDGSLQVTYHGHPLYYWSGDMRGEALCQHVVLHGGLWLILKADGTPNMAKGKGMHM